MDCAPELYCFREFTLVVPVNLALFARVGSRMKFVAALFLSVFAPFALADERVGRIRAAEGDVRLARGAESTPVSVNTPIVSGDSLRTAESARAEIQVGSTTFFLNENSRLHVTDLKGEAARAYLVEGGLVVDVRDAGSLELTAPRLEVSFPEAGRYRVDIEDGATEISVREGQAEVTRSTGERFVLASSQAARITGPDDGHTVLSYATRDGFDAWVDSRAKDEDDSVAAEYLSPDVTGYQDLDNYGVWQDTTEYGPVWVPYVAYSGWAPYRYGYWSNAHPWGRTWIDYHPWGFATFHHGRWAYLNDIWVWAPGHFARKHFHHHHHHVHKPKSGHHAHKPPKSGHHAHKPKSGHMRHPDWHSRKWEKKHEARRPAVRPETIVPHPPARTDRFGLPRPETLLPHAAPVGPTVNPQKHHNGFGTHVNPRPANPSGRIHPENFGRMKPGHLGLPSSSPPPAAPAAKANVGGHGRGSLGGLSRGGMGRAMGFRASPR
jgi:hypothetical protein